jgi:hypothetical protein
MDLYINKVKTLKECLKTLGKENKVIKKERKIKQSHMDLCMKQVKPGPNYYTIYFALWDYVGRYNSKKDPEFYGSDRDLVTTCLHIEYNRLRNRPPHTGSVEKDDEFMSRIPTVAKGYLKSLDDVRSNVRISKPIRKWLKALDTSDN